MIAYDVHVIPLLWLFSIVTALDVGHRVWLYSNPSTWGEKLPSKFGLHILARSPGAGAAEETTQPSVTTAGPRRRFAVTERGLNKRIFPFSICMKANQI